jgi:hypothetical protein
MRFATLIVTEGDGKRAITINMDHVVKVDHDDNDLVIHLSNGDTHYVDDDDKNKFRSFLQTLSQRTLSNPDR